MLPSQTPSKPQLVRQQPRSCSLWASSGRACGKELNVRTGSVDIVRSHGSGGRSNTWAMAVNTEMQNLSCLARPNTSSCGLRMHKLNGQFAKHENRNMYGRERHPFTHFQCCPGILLLPNNASSKHFTISTGLVGLDVERIHEIAYFCMCLNFDFMQRLHTK